MMGTKPHGWRHARLGLLCLLAMVSANAPAAAEELARAPYVQSTTPTSTVLVWTTDVATDSVVDFGTDPANLTQQVTDAAATKQHEVTLTGLTPSTRYFYRVGSSATPLAGGDATHYVDTAPPVGAKTKLRAWVVGDSGTGNEDQAAVRDAMLTFTAADPPGLFLHMGDMAYTTGTTTELTSHFFAPYADILRHTVTWPTLGNHEGKSSDSAAESGPYYTAYVVPRGGEAGGVPSGTEAYYAFDWANVHFVVLDSYDSPREPGGAMLTWLTQDLATTTQDWIIAYWHHPPYTKGSHNSDTEDELIEMRENALPILEAAGVDLVLGGHSHIYERSYLVDGAYDTPTTADGHLVDSGDGQVLGDGPYAKSAGNPAHEGAVYVVAGHGGTTLKGVGNHPLMAFSEKEFGSGLLDLEDNRLAWLNLRADGSIADRFTLVKGAALVLGAPDGGETLAPGEQHDIRWVTVGASVDAVDLELSVDGGQSFTPIATGVENGGTYAWTVPDVSAERAFVRVQAAGGGGLRDESNGSFRIVGGGATGSGGSGGGGTTAVTTSATSSGAGAGAAGTGDPRAGCGCRTGQGDARGLAFGLGALALVLVRRRR